MDFNFHKCLIFLVFIFNFGAQTGHATIISACKFFPHCSISFINPANLWLHIHIKITIHFKMLSTFGSFPLCKYQFLIKSSKPYCVHNWDWYMHDWIEKNALKVGQGNVNCALSIFLSCVFLYGLIFYTLILYTLSPLDT